MAPTAHRTANAARRSAGAGCVVRPEAVAARRTAIAARTRATPDSAHVQQLVHLVPASAARSVAAGTAISTQASALASALLRAVLATTSVAPARALEAIASSRPGKESCARADTALGLERARADR